MKADAIRKVTLALKERLQTALDGASVPGTVFVGPLDDEDSKGAPLILLVYRVVPNASLRNREHRVPSATAPDVDIYRNSLPLDLHYLLTVGTTPGSAEDALLWALGLALQTLQADPDLTGPAVDHETVRVTLEPLTTDETSRIWSLFPNANYRTSVALLATPVWIDPVAVPPEAGPVTSASLSGKKPAEDGS